jgi:hypothetical protein
VDTFPGRLHVKVPLPSRVSHGGMARRPPRCFDHGAETRPELCGLLLASDAPLFRDRHHEYGVDDHFDRFHVSREGISWESMGESNHRLDPCRLGSMGCCGSHTLKSWRFPNSECRIRN